MCIIMQIWSFLGHGSGTDSRKGKRLWLLFLLSCELREGILKLPVAGQSETHRAGCNPDWSALRSLRHREHLDIATSLPNGTARLDLVQAEDSENERCSSLPGKSGTQTLLTVACPGCLRLCPSPALWPPKPASDGTYSQFSLEKPRRWH